TGMDSWGALASVALSDAGYVVKCDSSAAISLLVGGWSASLIATPHSAPIATQTAATFCRTGVPPLLSGDGSSAPVSPPWGAAPFVLARPALSHRGDWPQLFEFHKARPLCTAHDVVTWICRG